jgi:hypothetical protein
MYMTPQYSNAPNISPQHVGYSYLASNAIIARKPAPIQTFGSASSPTNIGGNLTSKTFPVLGGRSVLNGLFG